MSFKKACIHLRVLKTYYIDILQIHGYLQKIQFKEVCPTI